MLSTAKTISDMFLLYMAPKRADYRLFVEQLSPDFRPDNDAERMLLEKILARKRRVPSVFMFMHEAVARVEGSRGGLGVLTSSSSGRVDSVRQQRQIGCVRQIPIRRDRET